MAIGINDSFPGVSLNTSKWYNWSTPSNRVVVGSGQLSLKNRPGFDSYHGIASNDGYSLVGNSTHVQVINAGDQSEASWEVVPIQLHPQGDSSKVYEIVITNNTVLVNIVHTGGSPGVVYSTPYVSASMKWFRIRETGGTMSYQYSTDGITWYTMYSHAVYTEIPITNLELNMLVGTWNAIAGETTAIFDNVNVVVNEYSLDGVLLLGDGVTDIALTKFREISGGFLLSGGVNTEIDAVFQSASTKLYEYKIYDPDTGDFLGRWDDVITEFGYSQEINSAGPAIDIDLARSADSIIRGFNPLITDDDETITTDTPDDIAAELNTTNAVGPGTTVDLNLDVKIYVFKEDSMDIDGQLVFTGYISKYITNYGPQETTRVTLFPYGADLDHYVLEDNSGNTRVPYYSEDPSNILKDALDRFNDDGGIPTYDAGTPGDTEVITNLITNPSMETNATGWVVDLGIGSRSSGGGAFGDYYYYSQNMGGSSISYTTPNLVNGQQYTFSCYLKKTSGSVDWSGSHNAGSIWSESPAVTTSWQRFSKTFTATANTPLEISIGVVGSDNQVQVDAMMLTTGPTLHDYFDGSSTDTDDVTYDWTGTAHGSSSTKTTVISTVGESIEDTATETTYTFNVNTIMEVIKKCLELAPTDWYWYYDVATNFVHFHPKGTEPDHKFVLGKHIKELNLEKYIEDLTNVIYFTGGTDNPVVEDEFTDTAGTQITSHTGDKNATWTKHANANASASLAITDANRVRHNYTGSVENVFYASGMPLTPDYEVECDVYIASWTGDMGICGRMSTSALTFYMARMMPTSNQIQLYKCIAGTFTSLGTYAYTNPGNGTTQKLKLAMKGSEISVYVNGDRVITATDTAIQTGLRSGFRSTGNAVTNSTGLHYDNFKVISEANNNVNLFKKYVDATSVSTYRRGLKRVTDNRIKRFDSMDIIADSQLERESIPRYRSSITILDKVYDIETIRLGQIVTFRNFGNFIDQLIMQIVRIDYSPDAVKLQLDTLLPSVPKRLEDIKRNLRQEEIKNNPDQPEV